MELATPPSSPSHAPHRAALAGPVLRDPPSTAPGQPRVRIPPLTAPRRGLFRVKEEAAGLPCPEEEPRSCPPLVSPPRFPAAGPAAAVRE